MKALYIDAIMILIFTILAHVYDEVQTPSGIPVGQEKHVIINKVGLRNAKVLLYNMCIYIVNCENSYIHLWM